MGKGKIRVRSDKEIQATVIAYQILYKLDPFTANMILLMSELSEFIAIPATNEAELALFMRGNHELLMAAFMKRFKAIDEFALKDCNDSKVLCSITSNLIH
jgi:hypothetical protein